MEKTQLVDIINNASENNLKMYFVTRILKEGIKKNSKVSDKYLFKVYQIEITNEIRGYLYTLSSKQFEKIANKKELVFVEYDVISDDTENLFTYDMKNKVSSFADVVYNQLKDSPQKITNLNEILVNENLWAYCLEFQLDSNESFYTFRKINPGKVGVDESDNNDKKGVFNTIRTYFDNNTNKLAMLKSETVYLDKQVDCIFYEDTFYVLKKFSFEQILGLQEDYKLKALDIADSIAKHSCFGEVKLLLAKVESNPSVHKKLIKLEKIGHLNSLDERKMKKLVSLGKKKKTELNIKDGKIVFETETDIDNAIKLLCDFYKTGDYSGIPYGTFAGKIQQD